ncbi:glutaredoxin family protein [Phormidesmis priestleyi]|uniref:glutaredoxin family protein n=1 Tax=Phormidesmis priestleyi TaxID=268141 RepID=UPI002F9132AF
MAIPLSEGQALMKLILYSKPGCHLCEGLQEKLEQIRAVAIELEIRDITTRGDWFQTYQYEIPVLYVASPTPRLLPRPSPRATVQQLESLLQKFES